MVDEKRLTNNVGAPVADNQNVMTAGPRGPMLLQDVWFMEKLAHFDREVIPERRMHAKGSGAYGTFTVTGDITKYSKAKIFSEVARRRISSCASPPWPGIAGGYLKRLPIAAIGVDKQLPIFMVWPAEGASSVCLRSREMAGGPPSRLRKEALWIF